jgi:hypothetical protein
MNKLKVEIQKYQPVHNHRTPTRPSRRPGT